MSFKTKILIEHSIKYLIIFLIAAFFWHQTNTGLKQAQESGFLDSIAVIMSLISVACITGYFAFSYTTVGKQFWERFFGYIATFFLGISLIFSLIILYQIAVIWVPQMQMVWLIILGSLYIGTVLFDNLDLLRMGMDVAATNFFETAHLNKSSSDKLSTTISFLKEGHRLPYANSLIGQALIELGKTKENQNLTKAGTWILDNSDSSQESIDHKVADAFSSYAKSDKKIEDFTDSLRKNQPQHIADNLIAHLIERVKD